MIFHELHTIKLGHRYKVIWRGPPTIVTIVGLRNGDINDPFPWKDNEGNSWSKYGFSMVRSERRILKDIPLMKALMVNDIMRLVPV